MRITPVSPPLNMSSPSDDRSRSPPLGPNGLAAAAVPAVASGHATMDSLAEMMRILTANQANNITKKDMEDIQKGMDNKMSIMQADISTIQSDVNSLQTDLTSRISALELSQPPCGEAARTATSRSPAPTSTSRSSGILLMPGETRNPTTNGIVRNRVWFKGWDKPQTALYFKTYGLKILQEHNINPDDAIIRNFGMNRQFSIDLLLGDTAARSLIGTFRNNPTAAIDPRSGNTLRINAVQDRSLEDRQKLGRLSPLFDKVKSLLKAKNKWNEDTMAPSSHASSQTFFIKKDEIYYALFAIKAGVLAPDLSECALLDISADEAAGIIASIPSP
jgi:hypothetical protein